MFKINDNYLKLPGSYLFSTIAKKVAAFKEANPDKDVISLGIGDVTQPLAPAVIDVKIAEMTRAQYDKFLKEGDGLDVVVVYESAPVLYYSDGSPMPPTTSDIWNQKLQSTEQTFKTAGSGPEGGE